MNGVSEEHPCPVCHKADWCLISADGKGCICQRTPSDKRCGSAGWFHHTNGQPITKQGCKRKRIAPLNWIKIMALYQSKGYSPEFGVIGGARFDETHFIPMYNENVEICGIQRVFADRSKAMIKGSQAGVFLRPELWPSNEVLITEGASDTVTAIQELGYNAIGKCSCNSGDNIVIKLLQCRYPAIVADNDPPGIAGARALACKLLDIGIRSVIIIPPYESEDLTDWVRHSGSIAVKQYIHTKLSEVSYECQGKS